MTSPISSKLSALQAYNRPENKPTQPNTDQQAPQKAAQSRRLSPALTIQLSVEAQKMLASASSPQKVADVQGSKAATNVETVQKYENGVGRREAPLNEPVSQKSMRPARAGSVIDIKV